MQPAFFLIRRLIIVIAVVVVWDTFIGQVFLIWIQCIIALFIMEFARPFKTKAERRIEIFNEVILMSVLYTMMLFTDFVPEVETKVLIGWLSCFLVALHFIVNLAIMLITSCKGAYMACRMNYLKKNYFKTRRAQQKNIIANHSKRRKRLIKLFYEPKKRKE